MKIAILTYHRATNYGAVLQAYALQRKIYQYMSQSDECRIINYQCAPVEAMRKSIHYNKRFVKDIVRFPFVFLDDAKCVKRFDQFLIKNMILDEDCEDLCGLNNRYDIFITGSDQVWNYDVCRDDETYFLNFVTDDKKKRSYAASLGAQRLFERDKDRILHNLKGFPKISVREKTGIDELKEIISDVRIDIDPTLLIEQDDWNKLIEISNNDGDYILIYCVAPPKGLLEMAKKLQVLTGYKVIYLTNQLSKKIKYRSFIYVSGIGPQDFLYYVKNAKYVLTTSFHGTVFSLIFHKLFYAELDSLNGHNDRIDNLLKRAKAEIFADQTCLFEEDKKNMIDWEKIDIEIRHMKSESERYLKGVVSGDE